MHEKMIDLFVPGRLSLFGEHSDWAGLFRIFNPDIVEGAAIVTGIEQGIYARISISDDLVMSNSATELMKFWVDFQCEMKTDKLEAVASSNSFFAYICGVASYVHENYNVGGLNITIRKMDMPIKRGLSSSASICVLVARAFNILYNLNLNTVGEMTVAYRGEQRTRSRCGRMDQACAFGIRPIMMSFSGDNIKARKIMSKLPLHYVFADLGAKKDTIQILSDLNKCYPYPVSDIDKNVISALGEDNQAIVRQAEEYMRNGDKQSLGCLMTKAQAIFDKKVAPASPVELAAPILHKVLNDTKLKPYIYGGKGIGSQGDGSVQFLAKDEICQQRVYEYLSTAGYMAFKLTIPPSFSITKAIIPVAGYGTRAYPFTNTIKKEFIPLVDHDGKIKPSILIVLEQLYDSGIEDIYIIIGDNQQKELYQRLFFSKNFSGNTDNDMYDRKLEKIGANVHYVLQEERKGYGHAVYQCRGTCGDQPSLLLLGDTVYSSFEESNCSQQLIRISERTDKMLISIHEIPLEQVCNYGIIKGTWLDEDESIMQVTHCIEKPSIEYAKKHLSMQCKGKARYFAIFGQYVVTPDFFRHLGDAVHSHINSSEIDITGTLHIMAQKEGLLATILNGTMYDIGNPEAYYRSSIEFPIKKWGGHGKL